MNYTSINNDFGLNINNYGSWINDDVIDTDINDSNDKNNEDDKEIDANKLLNDYNKINALLKLNINSINQLEIEKTEILNYKSSIFSKHQDIMIKLHKKEFGEMNDMNDVIIKYIGAAGGLRYFMCLPDKRLLKGLVVQILAGRNPKN